MPPDMERLMAIGAKYDIEILGTIRNKGGDLTPSSSRTDPNCKIKERP